MSESGVKPSLGQEHGNKGEHENQDSTNNRKHDGHKWDDGLDYVLLAVMRLVACLGHEKLLIVEKDVALLLLGIV